MELAERGCHGDDMHWRLQLLVLLSTSHIIQQGFVRRFEELINDHRGQIIYRLDMKSLLGNDNFKKKIVFFFVFFCRRVGLYVTFVLEEKQVIAIQKL